jgi:hypothetical protein
VISRENELRTVSLSEIRPDDPDKLHEVTHDENAELYFTNAIESFEQVAEDFPSEKSEQVEGVEPYGEGALGDAIDLSNIFGKQFTEARLINNFLELYPNSVRAGELTIRLNELYRKDTSLSGQSVNLDNRISVISLLGINKPAIKPGAKFSWGSANVFDVLEGDSRDFSTIGEITLERIIGSDEARVNVRCADRDKKGGRFTLRVGEPLDEPVCTKVLNLQNVNVEKLAKIRLLPKTRGTATETNFTVGIGIEKRAIELAPDKAQEKIDNLNETIDKWRSVSERLGKVNKGLKGACFATGAALAAKNFFSGLGGEGLARQKVMRGYWNAECERLFNEGRYSSIDACYLGEADKINGDVEKVTLAMSDVNERIKNVESGFKQHGEGLFARDVVDTEGAVNKLLEDDVLENYGDYVVDLGNGQTKTIQEIFGDADYSKGEFTYDQLRDVMLDIEVLERNPELGDRVGQGLNTNLKDIARIVEENKRLTLELEGSKGDAALTGLPPIRDIIAAQGQTQLITPISEADSLQNVNVNFDEEVTRVARVGVVGSDSEAAGATSFAGGIYLLGLTKIEGKDSHLVKQVFRKEGDSYVPVQEPDEFLTRYGLGEVRSFDSVNYNNPYQNAEIRYYETEPYKGYPAVVPFDTRNGWYVATEQNLPVFGGIASFEASGRPISFWVCNVGEDGREQFFEARSQDICQLINLNTGQPLNQFPGLSETQARNIINKAIQALEDASRQYGSGKNVMRIAGESVPVGRPAANIPGTQCQEFMPPEECALLFNVCDPVICPSSRCDFGGKYPVADVIQTGVVGSALLCLPNSFVFGGDVAIPVCLTGIQSGVDSYLSILKAHQQCLEDSIETGQTVGICDLTTSIYTCEFFWRQAAPLAEVVVPKAFEIIGGKTVPRGGGEYLYVQDAWQRTQDSVDFFTQQYAVNSLEAFKIRSTSEVGSQFCKAFVSAKGPKTFDSLIEPDSPPQFHAWFSSIKFTEATVPATAQYKVFYHIFAGNDKGVHFSVYLKDPPESSFFSVSQVVPVASGFVPRGEFATETADFTAPEGYKQLCVNIDGKEECGFKQVSTSFAINYLRDEFVSDEILRTDITSQRECISGGVNPGAILNPNLQEAAQEVLDPAVYNRGVVRICASDNPGSATEPERYVPAGYCNDQSITCWLDKKSVDNALSSNLNIDEGTKGETLSELKQTQIEKLIEQGEILETYQSQSVINDLKIRLATVNRNNIQDFVNLIDATFVKTLLNNQKAQLILLKGQLYRELANQLLSPKIEAPGEPLEEEPIPEPEKTYKIIFIGYSVDGRFVLDPEEERIPQVLDDLQLRIDHTCDFILVKINFEGAEYLFQEVVESSYVLDLDTSINGRYVAAAECWDEENNRRVGSAQAKAINVLPIDVDA